MGNLWRNQEFRDGKNPLVMYNDVELYDFVVAIFLTIVNELRNAFQLS